MRTIDERVELSMSNGLGRRRIQIRKNGLGETSEKKVSEIPWNKPSVFLVAELHT